MSISFWPGSSIADDLLDQAHPPVARFRLLSSGMAENHMLPVSEELAGIPACTACGNCLDVCPVIADKPDEAVVGRTSMALEHVVAEECRRCYRCIAACPQVDRPIKDYVRGFRRVERFVHWMVAPSAVALAVTGITIYHYKEILPTEYYSLLGAGHRFFAVALIVALLLYALADRRHFQRALRKLADWSRKDRVWWSNAAKWVLSLGREGRLMRGDFNTGQKTWYCFLLVAFSLFAMSGVLQWAGPGLITRGVFETVTLFHTNLALVFDASVLAHVCIKLIWPGAMDVVRGIAHSAEVRRVRGEAVSARVSQ